MNVADLLQRIASNLSVSRSFGSAYEKDGSLIIPVAFVAGGGGGGGGGESLSPPDEVAPSHDEEPRASHGVGQYGSGGGFGGVVVPVGVYVVKNDNVRWVPAVNANLVIVVVLFAIRMLMRSRRRARRRH